MSVQNWRHLDGPELTVQVTNGAVAISAKNPVQYSSDTVVVVTDNCEVAGVMHEDGDANETGLMMDLLVPGSVWEVICASLTTFNRGDLVYMADEGLVDGGTDGEIAIGRILNAAIASGDTVVEIEIIGGRYAHPGT